MAIPKGHKANFETMKQASDAGMLALIECTNKSDGEKAYVICCVNWHPEEDEEYEFVPIAKLFDGNPYDEILPVGAEDAVSLNNDDIHETIEKYKRNPIEGEGERTLSDKDRLIHYCELWIERELDLVGGDPQYAVDENLIRETREAISAAQAAQEAQESSHD